jgi:hypothetical protein
MGRQSIWRFKFELWILKLMREEMLCGAFNKMYRFIRISAFNMGLWSVTVRINGFDAFPITRGFDIF